MRVEFRSALTMAVTFWPALERALGELAAMDDAVGDLHCGLDDELAAVGEDDAGVADLPAGLGVEAGLVQHKADLGPRRDIALLS